MSECGTGSWARSLAGVQQQGRGERFGQVRAVAVAVVVAVVAVAVVCVVVVVVVVEVGRVLVGFSFRLVCFWFSFLVVSHYCSGE